MDLIFGGIIEAFHISLFVCEMITGGCLWQYINIYMRFVVSNEAQELVTSKESEKKPYHENNYISNREAIIRGYAAVIYHTESRQI